MSRGPIVAIGGVVIIALLGVALAALQPNQDERGQRIQLYCAAGIKRPIADLAIAFERQTGARVEVLYGGSGVLLSQLELTGSADCFIAGDDTYTDLAAERGLVGERFRVATMRPVLAVAAGNPLGITSLDDLLRSDVRLGLADPEAAAAGAIARERLVAAGAWPAVAERVLVYKPTVGEIALDLQIGSIDAAIVWDATVAMFNDDSERFMIVELPLLADSDQDVSIALAVTPPAGDLAAGFVRFVADPANQAVFTEHGFRPPR